LVEGEEFLACSYPSKLLLELEKDLEPFDSKLGMVVVFFVWCDNWYPAGYLLDKYGYMTVYDAGHFIGSKLSSIIREKEWYWPNARSDNIVEIQSRLPEVEIGDVDQAI
jgi:hypothetical protein